MNILQSWKQSLSLFAPAHFAQFVRDVAKSTLGTYKVLLQYWYIWTAAIVIDVLVLRGMFNSFAPSTMIVYGFTLFFLVPILFVIVLLATNASIVGTNSTHSFRTHAPWLLGLYALGAMLPIPLDVFYTLQGLFFLSQQASLEHCLDAIRKAAMMLWYNAPVVLIFVIIEKTVISLVGILVMAPLMLVGLSQLSMGSVGLFFIGIKIVWFIILPISVNIWANIYTRQLREQAELYN